VNKVENRIGVVGIVVEERGESVKKINSILSEYSRIIVGRLGVPYRERNVSVIAIIVDGTTDEIGAMTGKLGSISGVKVRSALTKK
jgi:putative iron-only hydrogenase system regulator